MIIAHDDPEIEARPVEIDRDGVKMPAYYAAPRVRAKDTPAIVMAMHLWGVNSEQRNTARRFAKCGFAIVVPDLYARFDAPDADSGKDMAVFVPLARSLTPDTVEPDISAATAWINERFPTAKTAIAGFCMGGTIALHRTQGRAGTFSAGAIWYGSLAAVDASNVDVPVVASFGADDSGIPLQTIDVFRAGLNVPHDIKVYPNAGHAFFDRESSAYDAGAAEDSWYRTIAFLQKHLAH